MVAVVPGFNVRKGWENMDALRPGSNAAMNTQSVLGSVSLLTRESTSPFFLVLTEKL